MGGAVMASTINATNTSSGIALTPDSSGVLALQTAGTTAVTVDASQNVGIGTTSPTAKLHVNFASSDFILGYGATYDNYYTTGASGIHVFRNQATERMRIDSSGNVLVTGGGGLGYGTGSGGTVTQITSRNTAVTINKTTGSITLVSAAGSASWAGFVVNNSLVAATDTIVLSIKSGLSNFYLTQVYGVTAGSFSIGVSANSGTATETPVINFAIIKGATS
jgi:hypothetical protein